LVVADNKLIALDRLTGSMDWTVYVPNLPATDIVANEQNAYYSAANGEIISFAIPLPKAQALAVRSGTLAAETMVVKAEWSWGMRLITALEQPPILLTNRLIIPNGNGNVVNLYHNKGQAAEPMPKLGLLSAPAATAASDMYFATMDGKLTAVEMTKDGPVQRWHYGDEGRIVQKPLTAGSDIFAVNEEGGMVCLDRQTGALRWKQRQIKQLISANLRALLAIDLQGNLRAFDRNHGVSLGSWYAQDYRLPVLNTQTDRVFLANHDGLIVAMRDVSPQHDQPILHFPPVVKSSAPVEVITEAPEVKRLTKPGAKQDNKDNSTIKSEEKMEKGKD
jgi:outer membrane protein assembly factor BamB